jgi:Protein of unknown function (DUF3592)
MSNDDTSALLIVALFMIFDVPVILTALIVLGRSRINKAENWKQTFGKIVESGARTVKRRRKGGTYVPNVVYEYEVGGQDFRNNRVHFGFEPPTSVLSWVEEAAAKYAVGQRVNVYYDPRSPADSVLEKAAPLSKPMRVAMLAIIAASAFALVVTFVALMLT